MDQENLQADILSFIEEAGKTIQKLESEKQALSREVSVLNTERLRLEKVASEATKQASQKPVPAVVSKEKVDDMLSRLDALNLVTKESLEKFASSIDKNPDLLVNLVNQLVDRMFKMASHKSSLGSMEDMSLETEPTADEIWAELARSRK